MERFIACEKCMGKGLDPNIDGMLCRACKGEGFIDMLPEIVKFQKVAKVEDRLRKEHSKDERKEKLLAAAIQRFHSQKNRPYTRCLLEILEKVLDKYKVYNVFDVDRARDVIVLGNWRHIELDMSKVRMWADANQYFKAINYIADNLFSLRISPQKSINIPGRDFLYAIAIVLTPMKEYDYIADAVSCMYRWESYEAGLIDADFEQLVKIASLVVRSNNANVLSELLDKVKAMEPLHPIVKRLSQRLFMLSSGDTSTMLEPLTGLEFEKVLSDQFRELGFLSTTTNSSGDFGADIVIETSDGTHVVVQAKKYEGKVNLKAVQEIAAAVSHYKADFGIVITTSGYFTSARRLAESNDIELWEEVEFGQFMQGDISFSRLVMHHKIDVKSPNQAM